MARLLTALGHACGVALAGQRVLGYLRNAASCVLVARAGPGLGGLVAVHLLPLSVKRAALSDHGLGRE